MTQHTQGDWTYNPIPQMGYFNIENAEGDIIGRFSNEADAIRAVAAPELLAALLRLVNEAEKRGGVPKSEIVLARAAIAEATGGE